MSPSHVRYVIVAQWYADTSFAVFFRYVGLSVTLSTKSTKFGSVNTIIKTASVCDGDARSVGGGRGWLADDTDGLASWPVTVGVVEVGVVSQPGADAERYRCACLHCTQGLAGRGVGYRCGFDWGRSSILHRPRCL